MKGCQEFIIEKKFADLDAGWISIGASKRGWANFLIGAAECPSCVNIIAIIPLVPIIPDYILNIHRMYQAFGGVSYFFKPYILADNLKYTDSPFLVKGAKYMDPLSFKGSYNRKKLPILIALSSSDEFMMMD